MKVDDPEPPWASVAVTVTLAFVTAVVGVPEIDPVAELIDRPAGSVADDQVTVPVQVHDTV